MSNWNIKTSKSAQPAKRWIQEATTNLADQIVDTDKYKTFFQSYKDVFVPYAGTNKASAHSLLLFLNRLGDLSPTHAAVIRSVKNVCFGGPINIVARYDTDFDLGERREPTDQERQAYYDFVSNNVRFFLPNQRPTTIRDFNFACVEMYKRTGNVFVEIEKVQVLGVQITNLYLHPTTTCLYLMTGKGEQKYIAVSPDWSNEYIFASPPDLLPLYPAYSESGRTMYHFCDTTNPWYGWPDAVSAMGAMYNEYQNQDYMVKATGGQFMGSVFIEIEDDDPELFSQEEEGPTRGEGLLESFAKNHTFEGDKPASIIVSTRGFGSKEAKVQQFSANTNENYFEKINEVLKDTIVRAHNWDRRLIGDTQANGLSQNVVLDAFKVMDTTVVRSYQLSFAGFMSDLIYEAHDFAGQETLKELSIMFSSPYQDLLDAENGTADSTGRN